jgi:hypothetical protein
MVDTAKNPLEQSDEDFTNMMPPVVPEEEVEQQGTAEADGDGSQNAGAEGDSGEAESGTEAEDGTEVETEGQEGGEDDAAKEGAEGEPASAGAAEEKPKNTNDSASGADSEAEAGAESADDKSKKEVVAEPIGSTFAVPTTIRANGKDVVLKDEAEAIQLMQMGAHYTRKMQELAPHRKLLMMLQNNGLADEAKLTFLIDLDKKNPEAIKKLIQDAGVDPLEIDTTTEADYLPGAYGVTDQEESFRSTLETLAGEDNGRETISEINTKWDETSKQVVWSNPEIMTIIHQQRANGVYDTITTEIDRQITLGKIPAGTPFLEAYRQVGDQLSKEAGHDPAVEVDGANNGQKNGGSGKDPTITAPVQVATRAATKAKLSNNDKASAASPTRASPATAKTAVNFFAQSDEDFLKQMDGRL